METPPALTPPSDAMVCFSHLRWNFVYQRPQHLMSRFARTRTVYFVEEPVYEDAANPELRVTNAAGGVQVVVPVLASDSTPQEGTRTQHDLLADFLAERGPSFTFWFQTPLALPIAPMELAGTVVYDCMDELSAFKDAPPALVLSEKQLLARADLVFTGGRALYEAKRHKHPSVHCFPSSIDTEHFSRARRHEHGPGCPEDIAGIPRPRIGFAGVIDERMDTALVEAVAARRPHYNFFFVGPVAKIDESTLPRRDNLHYLGYRDYDVLPEVMAEWDVAIMPFARNDATRFISPTKTPEYLAAGLPVVSTAVRDVVTDYGSRGLVAIADDPDAFAAAIDAALHTGRSAARLRAVDAALSTTSWDATWQRMAVLERRVRVTRNTRESADAATDPVATLQRT